MRLNNAARLLAWAFAIYFWFFTSAFSATTGGEAAAVDEAGRVQDILVAQPFQLDKPYVHAWRKEQPLVSAGYLLVLAVDPAFARPKQTSEPVLYVGGQTAERLNAGDVSGRLVVIVPSSLNAQGEVAVDLNKSMIWFGTPELPERIDATQVSAESNLAVRNGVKPMPASKLSAAISRGGKMLRLPNREALERKAAEWIQEYSPNETDLVRGLTVTNK
ncbi:MAG: hypothetical protein HYR55_18650 [Acidobacteria bacterium]|nr:hypothetical protein [Acidobacteriota bacterium]MBI3655036.1 hypothetical protein [Acidobacteriota bacterium]